MLISGSGGRSDDKKAFIPYTCNIDSEGLIGLLFNNEEKNMMVGAFVSGGLGALLNGYFGYRLASGTNIANTPSDPAYWLYANYAGYWVPNLSELIPWFGVPAVLYYLGKKKHSGKIRLMGLGGLVYGVSAFVAVTAFKASAAATGNMTYRVIGGVVR